MGRSKIEVRRLRYAVGDTEILAGVFQLRTAMAWQRVGRVEDVRPLFLRDAPDFQLVAELTPLPTG